MRSPTNERPDDLKRPAPLPAREVVGASAGREPLLAGEWADDSEGSPSASPPNPDPTFSGTGDERDGTRRAPKTKHVPERTCVLTRRTAPQHELIRLALGPDDTVHPDVLGRAGGRGAWIGVRRDELERALAKGKLRGVLARAFRTNDLAVPAELPARIADALERATLDRLGMEARASTLLTGSSRIEEAARSGAVELLLHAADARPDGRRSLDQAWRVGRDREGSGEQGVVLPVDRTSLSVALGRDNAVHVAVIEPGAGVRVGRLVDRWRHYLGSTNDTAGAHDARSAGDDTNDDTNDDTMGMA